MIIMICYYIHGINNIEYSNRSLCYCYSTSLPGLLLYYVCMWLLYVYSMLSLNIKCCSYKLDIRIYIYIYREREREIYIYIHINRIIVCKYAYVYIYIYIYIYVYMHIDTYLLDVITLV